ncbi:expressed unknown protein [Seminavis robusta]|uniref:Uncharacterized protein n=1 Tax=Seminavis robusta TaxID=568900 RepID=A0A9N8HM91_9STRA|nr:expressed unknown protein [Seminavis robusta]|eukprot:Sro728_g193700.1 n/a (661) ;mRNA; r:19384-21464
MKFSSSVCVTAVSMCMSLSFNSKVASVSGAKEYEWSTSSYEIWGSDQSNSVANQTALGVAGSFLWIWDAEDLKETINIQLQAEQGSVSTKSGEAPAPKSCSPDQDKGPCDLFTIYPAELTDSVSGETLTQVAGFGRWHGVTKDPQNKYVTANIFAPAGGFLGIVDATTKAAVALFRMTEATYSTGDDQDATNRNVHMSFWNGDGSAILVHNLAGKVLERINIERNEDGKITGAFLDKSAAVGLGKGMSVATEASFFEGSNAFGDALLGGLVGSYDEADFDDATPSGACKENGCAVGVDAGRPNNLPICPIIDGHTGLVFNTLAGGGLLVVDSTKTPMTIVGGYGNDVIYGAGVCGTQVGDMVYFTSGASASGAGATQSLFTVYALDPTQYDTNATSYEENMPEATVVFDDPAGTATGGKLTREAENLSGQIPGTTTRRDAHDLAGTIDNKYVHVVDRVQNVIEVMDAMTNERVGTYDLTTATGVAGDGTVGPCNVASVTDGGDEFPINDPAPDFIDATPDGKYMILSLRGPAPVSAGHAAQGSCPGVGVVELLEGGKSGKMVGVLRSTNSVPDDVGEIAPTGGAVYPGDERSDVHDAVVIFHAEDDHAHSSGGGEESESAGGDSESAGDETMEDGKESAANRGSWMMAVAAAAAFAVVVV